MCCYKLHSKFFYLENYFIPIFYGQYNYLYKIFSFFERLSSQDLQSLESHFNLDHYSLNFNLLLFHLQNHFFLNFGYFVLLTFENLNPFFFLLMIQKLYSEMMNFLNFLISLLQQNHPSNFLNLNLQFRFLVIFLLNYSKKNFLFWS